MKTGYITLSGVLLVPGVFPLVYFLKNVESGAYVDLRGWAAFFHLLGALELLAVFSVLFAAIYLLYYYVFTEGYQQVLKLLQIAEGNDQDSNNG